MKETSQSHAAGPMPVWRTCLAQLGPAGLALGMIPLAFLTLSLAVGLACAAAPSAPPALCASVTSATLTAPPRIDFEAAARVPASAYRELRRQIMQQVADAQHPTTPTEMMFFYAAASNDRELVGWLKKHGGKIDVISPPLNVTAMHFSVLDGQTTAEGAAGGGGRSQSFRPAVQGGGAARCHRPEQSHHDAAAARTQGQP